MQRSKSIRCADRKASSIKPTPSVRSAKHERKNTGDSNNSAHANIVYVLPIRSYLGSLLAFNTERNDLITGGIGQRGVDGMRSS